MNYTWYVLSLLVPVQLFIGALPLGAQQVMSPSPATMQALDAAIQQINQGEPEAVFDTLEELFETSPAWFSNEHYSLAYWLGLAYLEAEYPEDAREVWMTGLEALQEANLFDPRLATAFLTTIYEQGWREDYSLGAELYIRTLNEIDNQVPEDVIAPFSEYARALMYVLPEPIKEELGLSDTENPLDSSWSPFIGQEVTTWWRSQDPAPATRNNEMLEEHLQRIAFARQAYSYEGEIDERGIIYIRLGPPSSTTRVQFDKTSFRNKVIDRSLTINESDFPDNEFWYYDHIDNTAHFLFHDKQGGYKLGDITDLIPASIRSGLGSTQRGRAKARFLIKTLEEIYRQLSLYHEDYTLRYQEVASFSGMLDEAEIAAETAAIFETEDEQVESEGDENVRDLLANSRGPDFSAVGMPGSSFNPSRPDLYVQSVMANDRASDEMHRANREEYVPQTRSSVFDNTSPLPLLIRSARFLDPDGTTRTETYWAAPMGSLSIDDELLSDLLDAGYNPKDYLIVTSSVQKRTDYTERIVNHERLLIKDAGLGQDISLAPQTLSVQGDTGLYHVAIQWDQIVTILDETGVPVKLGPAIKANVYRQDSLQALNTRSLEMSDLKPMIFPENTEFADQTLEDAIIFPAFTIKNDQPIVLYFEVYNLTYGESDRTRYKVSYSIEEERGSRLRLNRRGNATTSFESIQEGSERFTNEQLVLDLSDWRGEGDISITVTITDEHTNQSVSRAIRYALTD